ncbi:hypothetical protein B0H17DRAFT_1128386 [Mycena rosella]|uniref:Uncharacterized protein n=1 Tax=Mycena rosella TaxID=1033263 RepID=A0AAD7DYS9_MYCRO|nr:hypothetical protein B0H17DRAFT_1128386 [Mycena rosella]
MTGCERSEISRSRTPNAPVALDRVEIRDYPGQLAPDRDEGDRGNEAPGCVSDNAAQWRHTSSAAAPHGCNLCLCHRQPTEPTNDPSSPRSPPSASASPPFPISQFPRTSMRSQWQIGTSNVARRRNVHLWRAQSREMQLPCRPGEGGSYLSLVGKLPDRLSAGGIQCTEIEIYRSPAACVYWYRLIFGRVDDQNKLRAHFLPSGVESHCWTQPSGGGRDLRREQEKPALFAFRRHFNFRYYVVRRRDPYLPQPPSRAKLQLSSSLHEEGPPPALGSTSRTAEPRSTIRTSGCMQSVAHTSFLSALASPSGGVRREQEKPAVRRSWIRCQDWNVQRRADMLKNSSQKPARITPLRAKLHLTINLPRGRRAAPGVRGGRGRQGEELKLVGIHLHTVASRAASVHLIIGVWRFGVLGDHERIHNMQSVVHTSFLPSGFRSHWTCSSGLNLRCEKEKLVPWRSRPPPTLVLVKRTVDRREKSSKLEAAVRVTPTANAEGTTSRITSIERTVIGHTTKTLQIGLGLDWIRLLQHA